MMATALQHQQAGRPQQAESLYRKILKVSPDFPDALHFLGLALHEMGKSPEGVRVMRKAVYVQPANAVYHNNLGFALKAMGQFHEAELCHREAVRLQPAYADAWYNLGVVLQDQNKLRDAEQAYRKAVELRPNYPKACVNLAGVLKELGGFEKSVQACETALLFKPDQTEAYLIMSEALIELGRPDEAERRLHEALRLTPNDPRLLCKLGKVLTELDRFDEAETACKLALQNDPHEADVYADLGTVAQMRGDHGAALDYFHKVLEIQPDCAGAFSGLAGSRKFSPDDGEMIAKMERTLTNGRHTNSDSVRLHFALGKIHDDCRQYDSAFAHYRAGNALKRQMTDAFDRDGHRARVDEIVSVFSRELVEGKGNEVAHASELPIFIVGMLRSGTTLVEQIISSHPAVKGAGELQHLSRIIRSLPARLDAAAPYPACVPALGRDAVHALAEEYLSRLPPRAHGETRVTDKLPGNYLHAGMIAILFRNARIIHCRRDPMDVCLSIYFQHFQNSIPYAYDLADVGCYFREYRRLMRHWRAVLGDRLFEVDYAELVDDQEAVSRRLIEHCGLEWSERCLSFHDNERQVKTASQWQVRQPIYGSSVQRWKNYEEHLAPLKEALGPDGGLSEQHCPLS